MQSPDCTSSCHLNIIPVHISFYLRVVQQNQLNNHLFYIVQSLLFEHLLFVEFIVTHGYLCRSSWYRDLFKWVEIAAFSFCRRAELQFYQLVQLGLGAIEQETIVYFSPFDISLKTVQVAFVLLLQPQQGSFDGCIEMPLPIFRLSQLMNPYQSVLPNSIFNYQLIPYSISKIMKTNRKQTQSRRQDMKRRPSIQNSPSLERPIYIITKNLNGPHILALTEHLDRHKIAYQMQQETATLGSKFNQRFFVIVDNKTGQVVLGPEFGSILMTIVGYPKVGKNKKNRYFQRPKDIVTFYEQFKNDMDISDRQKSLINSQYTDIVLENSSLSKINSKIRVRSISKYRQKQKIDEQMMSKNSSKQNLNKQFQRVKLIIIDDQKDENYCKLCDELMFQMNHKSMMERISIEDVYKRSIFQTKDCCVYYLVNQKMKREVIDTITIGEIIVFSSKSQIGAFKSIMREQKIYAICSQRNQTVKLLEKIGVIKNKNMSALKSVVLKRESKQSDSKLKNGESQESKVNQEVKEVREEHVNKQVIQKKEIKQNKPIQENKEEVSVFPMKDEPSTMIKAKEETSILVQPQQEEPTVIVGHGRPESSIVAPPPKLYETQPEEQAPSVIVQKPREESNSNELSKIEVLNSFVSNNQTLNVSYNSSMSQESSTGRKKIKRLKKSSTKSDIKKNEAYSQYFPEKKEKEKEEQKEKENQKRRTVRKKTLKTEERQEKKIQYTKSKKSLKFLDQISNINPRARRVKSIDKCQPLKVSYQCQNISTMTQNEYFPNNCLQVPQKQTRPRKSSELTFQSPHFFVQPKAETKPIIHAIFYRQFVPSFHNIIQLIKMSPSILMDKSIQIYQPFFNSKQFDRAARKIKLRLRQKNKVLQQYNFMIFLLKEEVFGFQKYCEMKNNNYNEDFGSMDGTFKSNFYSSGPNKINLYVFTEELFSGQKPEIIDYGVIKVFKSTLPCSDNLHSQSLQQIHDKIAQMQKSLIDV